MKLAITGKGGAGKTTVAVFLARYLALQGRDVILIDADPDANAALALGLEPSVQIQPIAELKDLIAERTGGGNGAAGLYTLNPKVDDIPERYALNVEGVKLLRMGRVAKGGTGCMCPENAFIRSLLAHLVFRKDQALILDMEAGVEHLGRGTARGVELMLVVVDPGRRSVQTAHQVSHLAADIGIRKVAAVINKYRTEEQLRLIESQVAPLPVLGRIPYDPAVAESDLQGRCPYTDSDVQRRWVEEILRGVSAATA